jgi:regulator of protease activity HflC (stomatin/prohibitin superfamily)
MPGAVGPGLVLIVPFIDILHKVNVDLRREELRVPDVIAEGESARVDMALSYRIIDPVKALTAVSNFQEAIRQFGETTLRSIVKERGLTALLSERAQAGSQIQQQMASAIDAWGLQIQSVEIINVDLPPEVEQRLREEAERERLKRLGYPS